MVLLAFALAASPSRSEVVQAEHRDLRRIWGVEAGYAVGLPAGPGRAPTLVRPMHPTASRSERLRLPEVGGPWAVLELEGWNVLYAGRPEEDYLRLLRRPGLRRRVLGLQASALEEALRRHPLDPERLICMGTSASGNACWELALRWPGVFAGIWPVSAGHHPSPDGRCLSNLEGLGIYVMHGERDERVPAAWVEAAVEVARAAGARVELARVPEAGHGSFGPEAWEAGLRWASAQRRSPPPRPRRCGPAPRVAEGPAGH